MRFRFERLSNIQTIEAAKKIPRYCPKSPKSGGAGCWRIRKMLSSVTTCSKNFKKKYVNSAI